MRLHRSTTQAVIDALDQIFGDGKYADKVIEKVLKQNSKWGARDRRFIAETTYNVVRWYVLLRFVARAKENEFWKLVGAWCVLQKVGLPDWDEFSSINPSDVRTRLDEADKVRYIRESVPEWLDELGVSEIGSRWDSELTSLNEEAPVVLRVNTIKTSKKDLAIRLEDEGIETSYADDFPDALILEQRQNIFSTPSFKEGFFEVQDAASQAVAPYLEVEPGMRVIDACAGAGGKTLHLAAMMKNKGRIIAMDVEQWKLDELMKRARRAGVGNLEPRLIDSSKVVKRLETSADRLLLDVPCTGLGVLKRNPDAKWKLSKEFVDEVKGLQTKILKEYSPMVKPGGLIVYSTCSILPSENERQIETFLQASEGKFSVVRDQHLWPSDGFDGFYMALIRRNS
jgi:16S rRNA (cytosine967-C5)-methyltransferase